MNGSVDDNDDRSNSCVNDDDNNDDSNEGSNVYIDDDDDVWGLYVFDNLDIPISLFNDFTANTTHPMIMFLGYLSYGRNCTKLGVLSVMVLIDRSTIFMCSSSELIFNNIGLRSSLMPSNLLSPCICSTTNPLD